VQSTWLYLEPVFASPDIMRQMPREGRKFASVDKMFRSTMSKALANPLVIVVFNDENLLSNFNEANNTLDSVQKGLNDYLETKRAVFPRFFFLSNDELLDILAETRDPTRVVPHLPKCFEGVNNVSDDRMLHCSSLKCKCTLPMQVKFDDSLCIIDILSCEGERVPLATAIDPNGGGQAGLVELWLLKLESVIRDSLRGILTNALSKYAAVPRIEFVLSWPSQIVESPPLTSILHSTLMRCSGVGSGWNHIYVPSRSCSSLLLVSGTGIPVQNFQKFLSPLLCFAACRFSQTFRDQLDVEQLLTREVNDIIGLVRFLKSYFGVFTAF
jgi:hypothetical protein